MVDTLHARSILNAVQREAAQSWEGSIPEPDGERPRRLPGASAAPRAAPRVAQMARLVRAAAGRAVGAGMARPSTPGRPGSTPESTHG